MEIEVNINYGFAFLVIKNNWLGFIILSDYIVSGWLVKVKMRNIYQYYSPDLD